MKYTKIILGSLLLSLAACQSDDSNVNTEAQQKTEEVVPAPTPSKTILWAGEVQAKTEVYQQPYYEESYWEAINEDVDYEQIYNYVLEEVLSGRRQAYSILTEDTLSIEAVKDKLGIVTYDGTEPEPIKAEDLSLIRTRESWHFNEQEFTLHKEVSRIGFLSAKLDFSSGEYLGDVALFYVYMGKEE